MENPQNKPRVSYPYDFPRVFRFSGVKIPREVAEFWVEKSGSAPDGHPIINKVAYCVERAYHLDEGVSEVGSWGEPADVWVYAHDGEYRILLSPAAAEDEVEKRGTGHA